MGQRENRIKRHLSLIQTDCEYPRSSSAVLLGCVSVTTNVAHKLAATACLALVARRDLRQASRLTISQPPSTNMAAA